MSLIYFLVSVIRTAVWVYSAMLFARIVISWFPEWQRYKIVKFLGKMTDPYLNIFRKAIPPLGGVLDISPILAFFSLQILEYILIRILL